MPFNFSKGGFEASIKDEETWTFYCGHSNLYQGKHNGIVFEKNSLITNPITSKNDYIGIFGCSSSNYASSIFSDANCIFSIKDKSGEGRVSIHKTLFAAYFLIENLIKPDEFNPENALKAANDGLKAIQTKEKDIVILEKPKTNTIQGGH